MSFDLAATPTLQAVASDDEQQLGEDLRARFESATREAEEQPEVVEASQQEQQSREALSRLRKAERALSQFTKEAGEKAASLREQSLDALIASACDGEPEFKTLRELAVLDHQCRQASRAIERLVEYLIPRAQWSHLRAESHSAYARSRALEQIAQERAERVLAQLKDAVSEEVVLPVDLSKGVSGALLAYAAEHKARAVQIASAADEFEAKYLTRQVS
jgi:hypothetical protein